MGSGHESKKKNYRPQKELETTKQIDECIMGAPVHYYTLTYKNAFFNI